MALYPQDGTGRDTYILNNNGGFTMPNDPNMYPPNSKLQLINIPINLATFFTPRNHKAPINFTATGEGFNKLSNNKII